jgi:FG-GAP-like repeat/ASPIC and UnbV
MVASSRYLNPEHSFGKPWCDRIRLILITQRKTYPRHIARAAGKLLLLLLVPFLACQAPPEKTDEFENVRLQLENSHNWCFGEQNLRTSQANLKKPDLSLDEQCWEWRRLSVFQLRLGQTQEALESVERAFVLAQSHDSLKRYLPDIHLERGIAWMRYGELRNCVISQGATSCIFPLEGDGVHADKGPAQKALADFTAYAESFPTPPTRARWLLNIVAMQIGQYPDAVPESWRIPADKLQPANPNGRFQDVGKAVGLRGRDLAGGAVVEDLNGDGLLDILTSSCGFADPVKLYTNMGDGSFREDTEKVGLSDQKGAFNVRVADYDGDGDFDLLLLRGAFLRRLGRVRNSLMRQNKDGTFTDVTHLAGLAEPAYPTGTAAWGDFNGDGALDLFVANESVLDGAANVVVNNPCQLFLNQGDGTFTDVASESGVDASLYAKGVAAGDIDNDGDLDLFVTDFGFKKPPKGYLAKSLLFVNNGDGTFVEQGERWGIQPTDSRFFGTWFFDYDNDGWLDLFVASYEVDLDREVARFLTDSRPTGLTRLYHNEGGKGFREVSQAVGLRDVHSPMGCTFGDLDNDGFLDIYMGTGAVRYEYLVPNIALKNEQGRSFHDVTFPLGLGHLQKGHGMAFADLNQDGHQDLYVQLGGNLVGDAFENSLFSNPGTSQNGFLVLDLQTSKIRTGTRIKVTVETEDGVREIHRAAGLTSSFGYTPYRQEIGLGRARAVREVEVRWPSGARQTFQGLQPNKAYLITEGQDEAQEQPFQSFVYRTAVDPSDPWCLTRP